MLYSLFQNLIHIYVYIWLYSIFQRLFILVKVRTG